MNDVSKTLGNLKISYININRIKLGLAKLANFLTIPTPSRSQAVDIARISSCLRSKCFHKTNDSAGIFDCLLEIVAV